MAYNDSPPKNKTSLEPFNPVLPEFHLDPYSMYAHYRSHDPVHWSPPPRPEVSGTWYLTKYADILNLLKDPRVGRELHKANPSEEAVATDPAQHFVKMLSQWLALRDPPDHTRSSPKFS